MSRSSAAAATPNDGTQGEVKDATLKGLGNLIIGYDENDPAFHQARTGSHNLVVGSGHNYLSYGGIVAGLNNLISAPYATVTDGNSNTASAPYATVSGGSQNKASGVYASVSGGQKVNLNTAYGWSAGSLGSTAVKGNFTSP